MNKCYGLIVFTLTTIIGLSIFERYAHWPDQCCPINQSPVTGSNFCYGCNKVHFNTPIIRS